MADVVIETSPGVATPSAAVRQVDWGALAAGAVLAAAISFVLLTFGTAIGLSATSPWPSSGLPAWAIASLAVFWVMAQQIGAFLAGGYVAGRMRARFNDAAAEEVQFRDGLHGGLVWALGVVIGVALAIAAGSALARTGTEPGAATAASVASKADPMELALDAMLRPAGAAAARTAPSDGDPRAELSRILASTIATGPLSDQNRAYLTQRVAQLTGLSPEAAETRVNEALSATRRAADKTRRAAVLTGFITAASLVVSFGAAWWAAVKGGQHRDNATPARTAFDRLPRRSTTGS